MNITQLATTRKLLVVSDFDGTLAEFSTDAMNVPINQRSVLALQRLATLPDTTVAVLSGRHLAGLQEVSGFAEPFILCGSHGAEQAGAGAPVLTTAQQDALDAVSHALEAIVAGTDAFVEYKPYQRVLHTIRVQEPGLAEELTARAQAVEVPGAKLTMGKNMVEFSVSEANKGTWIAAQRSALQATATVFLGDDVTDEDGFRVLEDADLGVKVGTGETAAGHRVADVAGVADFLEDLANAREEYLTQQPLRP